MRILQIVQRPQRRGAETFAFQLSGRLRRDGQHEVGIVYLYPSPGAGELPLGPDDRCLNGDDRHFTERTIGFNPALMASLRDRIAEFDPDIVQVNGARTVKYGALARRWAGDAGWSLVYRNIGDPRQWVSGWRTRFFYRRFVIPRLDGVIGVSRTTLDVLRDFYGLDIPTAQIPRGVEPKALIPGRDRELVRGELGAGEETPVLIYLGSLTPEKRIDRLLRVLREVRAEHADTTLWLVGGGPLRDELERQAASLGIEESVRFLGVRDHIADYVAAADVLVLSSDTEGVPGVLLEGGWLRRPVVATDVGGVGECVLDDETGLLVAPEDEAGFAEAVGRLLDDPDLRRRMGDRAHRHVAGRFTMERIAAEYLEFYRRVLTA